LNIVRQAYWAFHHAWKGLHPKILTMEAHRLMPEGEARLDLALRLRRQLAHFSNDPNAFPQWRDLAVAEPESVWRGWTDLPIMTKQDLQERFPAAGIVARNGGHANSTGGSTGEPTRFVHDQGMLRACTATMYYGWRRMGWRPGMPVFAIWGAQRDIGLNLGWQGRLKQMILAQFGGIWMNNGFALDPTRAMAFLGQILASPLPCVVYGYTSLLEEVARQAEVARVTIPPGQVAAAWNGGETLFPEQSAHFQRVFGVPIQNYYGGREVGVMAFQSQGEEALQVLRPFILLELVNEVGQPCAAGEEGRLLVTSTVCQGSPFMRYEIGDLATFSEGQSDGSGLRGLREIRGRVSSTLVLNGRSVSSLYWNHLFKDYSEIRAFQVRARGSALHIFLNAPRLPKEALERIRATILAFLGPLPLTIETVVAIPLSAAGKLIHVIQEPEGLE
jgi:phenylacetate-CoA ligase